MCLLKTVDASGGYLSCFGKKGTKEPTWGERGDRRLWRRQGAKRVAAVGV